MTIISRTCEFCGGPLKPGAKPNTRTCCRSCAQYLRHGSTLGDDSASSSDIRRADEALRRLQAELEAERSRHAYHREPTLAAAERMGGEPGVQAIIRVNSLTGRCCAKVQRVSAWSMSE